MPPDTPKQDNESSTSSLSRQYPQYPSYLYASPPEDEIDLLELWNAIWRGKWIVLAVTGIFAVGAVLYVLSLPNIYQSRALLAPSEDAQGGGMARMAGQLSGLASLAGINMGAGLGDNKVAVAKAVLTSRQFISSFIEKYGLLPELMAVKSWDHQNNKIIFDAELYDEARGGWVRVVDPPRASTPSAWEAYEAFRDILNVSQDNETGFVTVSVEHQSPHIAQRWVTLLVQEINQAMKEKDVAEAQRSIDFLQGQLSSIALADMRTVFYRLIEEQTKTVMLSEVREEYVFSTIDPPVVAEERAKPNRGLICILITLLGMLLSIIVLLARAILVCEKPNL
jgi:uncharacterized protein involved in exopolysaccharide biosynthesis